MRLKLLLALIILSVLTFINAESTEKEYYDPNDDPGNMLLWEGLFVKLNTLLQETANINQNILDLNKRFDNLSKRQDDQKTELQDLKAMLQTDIKCRNENRMDLNKRQDIESTSKTSMQVKELHPTPPPPTGNPVNSTIKLLNQNWTTILRRQDGSVDFYRNWTEYKNGFGDSRGEFFIGLDKLHEMTSKDSPQELMIVLKDWNNEEHFAKYDHFQIGGESEKYALEKLGKYSGNAEDALFYHKDKKFTTFDQDNDAYENESCAKKWHGAWWFHKCYHSHLTGPYRKENESKQEGVAWMQWKGHDYSLKYAEMKIRTKTL